jgi:hypothetical protein
MEQAHSTPRQSLREGEDAHEFRIADVERDGLLSDMVHPALRSLTIAHTRRTIVSMSLRKDDQGGRSDRQVRGSRGHQLSSSSARMSAPTMSGAQGGEVCHGALSSRVKHLE